MNARYDEDNEDDEEEGPKTETFGQPFMSHPSFLSVDGGSQDSNLNPTDDPEDFDEVRSSVIQLPLY